MNILFVSYHYWPPHFGGELKISIERFESLSKRGHKVTVLTSGVPGMPRQEVRNGILIKRSPQYHESRWGRGFRRTLFPLWVTLQTVRVQFDIIHFGSLGGICPFSNTLGMLLIILMAKIKKAKTVYVHSLSDTEEEMFTIKGYKRRVRNFWLKRIDGVVSVSPALHFDVSKFHQDRSYLITNAVRNDIFTPITEKERDNFREKNQIKEEDVIFSFLGSISKRKGFDLITKAFIELSRERPNWLLWIVGPKTMRDSQNINKDEVSDLIYHLSEIQQKVKFWGRINDRNVIKNIIGASDVFLFPTRKEGMPLAPMEAMSCGVPPIISRISGVTDLVNIEDVTGFYCEVGDLDSLKEKMIVLGTNKNLRKSMGMAARKKILADFSWDEHICNWEFLYRRL